MAAENGNMMICPGGIKPRMAAENGNIMICPGGIKPRKAAENGNNEDMPGGKAKMASEDGIIIMSGGKVEGGWKRAIVCQGITYTCIYYFENKGTCMSGEVGRSVCDIHHVEDWLRC